jgi:PAS domain S-box-containing protein
MRRIKEMYHTIVDSKWFGYVFALGIVALATWGKLLAEPTIIPSNIPILYILAIVLTATFFGIWSSFVCCILSVLAYAYFFLPPVHTFVFNVEVVPIASVFIVVGLIISYLSHNLRKKSEEARKEIDIRKQRETELISYREHLEDLVEQRTNELEKEKQELRESEERLERSQEMAHLGSWELDVNRNSLSWSDEVYRIFGLKPQEFAATYEAFLETIHPDDRVAVDTAYTNSLKEGRDTYEIEHRIIRKNTGEVRYILEKCNHVRDENGKVVRSLGMVHDITERKKNEEALHKAHEELEERIKERTKELAEVNKALQGEITEHKQAREAINFEKQRFNDVLEMLPAYVVLLTPDYHVPFANRFFEERFGKSMGKRCFEYLFHRTEPCEICETYKVLKTNKPHHWEWIGPDDRNYDIFDFPFKDADGSPLIMEMGIDITEQKNAQAALHKSQAELETRVEERTKELRETRDYLDNLINYANAPIIVWNPDFKITRFNHAFEHLTGLTADEVIGGTLDILFPAESHNESMRQIHRAIAGERLEIVEIPIIHKDGNVRILLWNSTNLYSEDGKTIIATIAQGQDITERKKTEQMKDEFISLVSHELRTPMTVITGSLKTAISKGISPKDKTTLLLNAIEGAGALSAILENLLELSRYQTGRLEIHREAVTILDIAQDVIEKLKTRSEDHTFKMEFAKNLASVEADPIRVERIIYNLVENAIKYSPEGSEIKVFAQEKNGQVIIGISDKGIGISKEEQSKIFEPFERLGKAARKGLGLGLVVCKRLVEAQGGKIWVESQPNKGSIFYFSLPIFNKST